MITDTLHKISKESEDLFNTYHLVTLRFPFIDQAYHVGCYHNEKLAIIVSGIVREILENDSELKENGGFWLRTEKLKGKIVKCPAGLKLEEPGSAITIIEEQLSFPLLKKLCDSIPSFVSHAAILRKKVEECPPPGMHIFVRRR